MFWTVLDQPGSLGEISIKTISKMRDQQNDFVVIAQLWSDWWLLESFLDGPVMKPSKLPQPPNGCCFCMLAGRLQLFLGSGPGIIALLRPDIFTYNNILAKCARTAPENSFRNCFKESCTELHWVALSCKACELNLVGVLMRRVRYLAPLVLSGSCGRHKNPDVWHRVGILGVTFWLERMKEAGWIIARCCKWFCSLSHSSTHLPSGNQTWRARKWTLN